MSYCVSSQYKTLAFSCVALLVGSALVGCSSQLKYEPTAQNDGRGSPVAQAPQPNSDAPCAPIYVVGPGDSLGKIARKCNVSLALLQEVNNIQRADLIYINQALRIPEITDGQENRVPTSAAPQMTSSGNTQLYGRDRGSYAAEPIEPQSETGTQAFNWVWPMSKQTDYRFVQDAKGISALEIYGYVGQSVNAMAEGVVVFAGDGIADFGNMVMLRHPDGKLSVYAHNNKLLVQKGDSVKAGQQIAEMGATGVTQRPKLYVETRYRGQKISIKNILAN